MDEELIDLEINGSGGSAGGNYNNVIIQGNGKIDGDLNCIRMEIHGQCEVNGNVKAEFVNVHGHNSIKGSLDVNEIKIHGEVEVNGDLSAEEAITHGFISVNGNCNAETFTMEGFFKIRGLLNTGELELNLHGPAEAREIGGEKITVKREGKSRFNSLIKKIIPSEFTTGLTTDVIEGDDIYLEYTKAKIVRGKDIELGQGCEIKLVEYDNNFKQAEESNVTTYRQL